MTYGKGGSWNERAERRERPERNREVGHAHAAPLPDCHGHGRTAAAVAAAPRTHLPAVTQGQLRRRVAAVQRHSHHGVTRLETLTSRAATRTAAASAAAAATARGARHCRGWWRGA